jgi:hypothetical protein
MRQIFPPEHELLSARIARVCFLHEDLRIELYGIEAETLEDLDIVSVETRRHYFLRRSIATLHEFSEGIRMLDEFPAFAEHVRSRNCNVETDSVRCGHRGDDFLQVSPGSNEGTEGSILLQETVNGFTPSDCCC